MLIQQCAQTRKEMENAWELIYATLFFLQPQEREEACKSNKSVEEAPAARSLPTEHAGTLANEFMAAKLISWAIKVLRFFSTQRQWLGEINWSSNDRRKYPNV